jgi:3',5'-cyclic AMP phosphodiesterase CpdA
MEPIAVIADPHFHDINYRPGTQVGSAVRTLADTCESTRVFNESYNAFKALLDDIVRRSISIVIVDGDLTDDGQASTMTRATDLLRHYSERHGLRFFATLGNHDVYAIHGRHQSKRFLDPDGRHTLVTSDPDAPWRGSQSRVVTPEMYCGGYAEALRSMASFGFFRRDDVLHWETPFGASDDLQSRTFDIRSADGSTARRMIDASYLVEPVPGLWLLSIDSNVFEPRDGEVDPAAEKSYIDSTDAGWNAMLRNKPFIFDWMRDVAQRARAKGKKLLTFSHYPVIDPLNASADLERELLGETSFVRRSPGQEVGIAAAATGIGIHFSGHLHINDTAVLRSGSDFLVNVAVPSIVGFPPAYKIATFNHDHLHVDTVVVGDVEGFDAAFDLYRAEASNTGEDYGRLLDAQDHADFLSRHLEQMVARRYLPKEWPDDLAQMVRTVRFADLWNLAAPQEALSRHGQVPSAAVSGMEIPFFTMVVDWYHLRKAREIALDYIPQERLEAYRSLAKRYVERTWRRGSLEARICGFLTIFGRYLESGPSRSFSIDLKTGEFERRSTYLARTDLRQIGAA